MPIRAEKAMRTAAIAAAIALTVALVPSTAASAAPDYDRDRVHFLPLDEQPNRIALSPDGRRLYGSSNTIDGPGELTVVDVVSGSLVAQKTFEQGVGDVEVSPDSRRIYFTHGGPNWLDECFVSEVDASTLTVLRDLKVGVRCREIQLSQTGKTLFVSDNTDVLFVDVSSGSVRVTIPVPQGPGDLALSADGSKLYVAEDSRGRVHTISVAAKALWGHTTLSAVSSDPDGVSTLHMSPDGKVLYAISDRAIYTVPLPGSGSGSEDIERIPASGHHGTALSRDGKRLYLSSNVLSIFHTDTGNFSTAPTEWGRGASALVESTDGRRLHLAAGGYIITLGATRSLVYPDSSLNAVAGKRFVSTKPVFRYGYADPTYRVSPALPPGLRLNSSTGVISGTPARAQSTRSYRVYTDRYNADTGELERVRASITVRIVPQAPTAKISLSKTTQKYGTKQPAKLTAVVTPGIPGTFRIYDGSTHRASAATKTGRIVWTLPRTLRTGAHTLKVVFVPSNRDVYRSAISSSRKLTVIR